jgi:hypothetical protein
MKVTTQSSQADVPAMTQSAQSIMRVGSDIRSSSAVAGSTCPRS